MFFDYNQPTVVCSLEAPPTGVTFELSCSLEAVSESPTLAASCRVSRDQKKKKKKGAINPKHGKFQFNKVE